LDHPGASRVATAGPITNLIEWIKKYQPMDSELAYVGQQLWSTLSAFLSETRGRQPVIDPDFDWWQFGGLLTIEELEISLKAGELSEKQAHATRIWLSALREGISLKEACQQAGQDYRRIVASWRAARRSLKHIYDE
jgi:hypothetical protein